MTKYDKPYRVYKPDEHITIYERHTTPPMPNRHKIKLLKYASCLYIVTVYAINYHEWHDDVWGITYKVRRLFKNLYEQEVRTNGK